MILNVILASKDFPALQNWVIQRIAKQMRTGTNPSIATRRDMALIAALCAAPARGTPRRWPQNCLKITENEVLLWDAPKHRMAAPEKHTAAPTRRFPLSP